MYLDAMEEVGATTQPILGFLTGVADIPSLKLGLKLQNISEAIKEFVSFNFALIQDGQPHLVASAFTFGREDVIPDMFMGIIEESGKNQTSNCFKT